MIRSKLKWSTFSIGFSLDFSFSFLNISLKLIPRLLRLLNDDETHRFSSVIYPSQHTLLFMSNGERTGYLPQQFKFDVPFAFGLGLHHSKRKPPKN